MINAINLTEQVNLPSLVIVSMAQVDERFDNIRQFADFISVNDATLYSW